MDNAFGNEPLIPLLDYVQWLERAIHEIPSHDESESLIKNNFSSDARLQIDKQTLDRGGFLKFTLDYREKFTFLDYEFYQAASTANDYKGQSGTVGVGIKVRGQRKEDGKLFEAILHGIYQIEWLPTGRSGAHRRQITKVTRVLQGPYPVSFTPSRSSVL
ncbi:hypothetical protein BO71DRAFT_428585 [Aspergillus ellipticus CBS 707.79]|uniref:Uncharacterized protein n=1 Tax=Aspergillus ellipticus CBS 707.79 TaxID=1448320 RepID=A0A319DWW2_9EURO|nr:hypothetical protein BO71DRAFT_428585 [Aspergillus ellipticus CBS 707.79]